jgi:putative transcriptional regulator
MVTKTKQKHSRRKVAGPNGAKRRPTSRIGQEIIQGLKEIRDALASGVPLERRFTVRTVSLPPKPNEYTAAKVRATRDLVGASQAVFASLVGVSTVLAQSWEQGYRKPSPLARRVLDEINRDPKRWREMIGSGSDR